MGQAVDQINESHTTVRSALKKSIFKHMEAELYAYPETKKEICRLREDILLGTADVGENVGQGANSVRIPSKPTERIAIRLTSNRRLRNLEEMVEAIDTVYTQCDEDRKELIRLKYWTRPQTKTWEGIAQELKIGRATAFRWRKEIVQSVGEILGWR